MMENIKEKTLKSIVLAHHEYIHVLEKYSLDFCCKGGKTLNDACADKNIAVDKLLEELELTVASKKPQMPFSEMNAEQLWETTKRPDGRTLRQVTIDSAAEADRVFSMLMGDDVPPRREFIERNAKYAKIDA